MSVTSKDSGSKQELATSAASSEDFEFDLK
jgi:hypothetical protein